MRLAARAGFSLIELLVVVAIIAMIWTIAVPAANSMMMASRLSYASADLTALISQARQTAIARNHTVEVRFYQFGDPEIPGETALNPDIGKFRAMQLFEYGENGLAIPVTKVERLPDGIVLDSNLKLSTLFDPKQKKTFAPPLDAQVPLPRGVGVRYKCMAFQFMPSGSTKLGFGKWFVTLHKATDGDNLRKPPANYVTVQVEAVTGAVKAHRP